MACDIIINFSGNPTPLKLEQYIDFSDNPLLDIAKALSTDKYTIQQIKENFRNFYAIRSEGLSYKNNIGNTSIRNLIESISIPGGWPSIQNLQNSGLNVDEFNIIFTEEKDSMFLEEGFYNINVGSNKVKILRVNRGNLYKFRNWLLTHELLKDLDGITFSPEFLQLIKKYKTEGKVIINQFINGDKDFSRDIIVIEGKNLDVESIIQEEIYKIQSQTQKRIFNSELFNAIIGKITKINGEDFRYRLSLQVFYDKATMLLKDDPDIKMILDNKKISDIDKVRQIISKLRELDRDFPYTTVSSISDGIIIFNTPYQTLNSRYDLSYQQIQEQFVKVGEAYRGYDIYMRDGKYYISRDPLTEVSYAGTPYKTLEDAKKKINSLVGYEYLGEKLHLQLKLGIDTLKYVNLNSTRSIDSTQSIRAYKSGEIIKSLDINISKEARSRAQKDQEIQSIINNGTYNQFVEYIKLHFKNAEVQTEILTVVDDAEKAACFLYLREESDYIQALEKIKNANYKYYYVVTGFGSKGSRVIQISEDSISVLRGNIPEDREIRPEKLKNQDLPKAILINKFVEVIQKRLSGTGFTIEIMTQSEIKDEFGDSRVNAQGFVTGNRIIINGTIADVDTPMHEYAHVLLGLIKANNYSKYRELVDMVLTNFDKGKPEKDRLVQKKRMKFKSLYKGMSDSDIDEEVFADLFAGYILNSKYKQFVDLSGIRESVTESGKIIWDMIEDKSVISLAQIWDYPLKSLTSLNSDFIIDLGEDDSVQSRFKVYRQATNWIQQKINDGEITENCLT